MDWMFKPQENHNKIKKKYVNKKKTTEFTRLKYCESCKFVWEIDITKKLMRYNHMPTYGLLRKNCKLCIKQDER